MPHAVTTWLVLVVAVLSGTLVDSTNLNLARFKFNLDTINVNIPVIPDDDTTGGLIGDSDVISPLSPFAAHFVSSPITKSSLDRAFFFPGNGSYIDVDVPFNFFSQSGSVSLSFFIYRLSPNDFSIFSIEHNTMDSIQIYLNSGFVSAETFDYFCFDETVRNTPHNVLMNYYWYWY